jgi:RNA polymerase sigma-70 factor (ECF subfamily)
MELSDRALVAQARSGDPDAFRVLVERHSRVVFRVAFRMTGNRQDAEDVVQEAFLRAYRQLGRFDERAEFGTWLYRIATNCALDTIRARRRRSENLAAAGPDETDPLAQLPAHEPSPERSAWSAQLRGAVEDAMNELSPTERAAFVLRHFEGMRIEEVGRALECRPGAAKHSVFRAVQKLRRALEPLVTPVRS